MAQRQKVCLICLYHSRMNEANNGKTKTRRAFYTKLVSLLEASLARKARSYNYKSLHLCSLEHKIEATRIFSFLRTVNHDELQRRRRAYNSAVDKLSRERIQLSKLIIENADEFERAKAVENVAHCARILRQRERRLKELEQQCV